MQIWSLIIEVDVSMSWKRRKQRLIDGGECSTRTIVCGGVYQSSTYEKMRSRPS
jgi:hypothetical protein